MAVAPGAIDDACVLAVVAPFDGAAQGGGTAVHDGLHEAVLMQGQGMCLPVGGAVLSKDVGQLGSRPGHSAWLGCGRSLGSGPAITKPIREKRASLLTRVETSIASRLSGVVSRMSGGSRSTADLSRSEEHTSELQ